MADDLAAWLTQIWDEDEKRERARIAAEVAALAASFSADALTGDPEWTHEMLVTTEDAREVLARIAADRQILAMHTGFHECPSMEDNCGWVTDDRCSTVRLLALPYADRPGYREEWAVSR